MTTEKNNTEEFNSNSKAVNEEESLKFLLEDPKIDPSTVSKLSSGIINSCEAELSSVQKELKDFTDQQDDLIKQLMNHNLETENSPVLGQLKHAMDCIGHEMDRLNNLRSQMTAIQDRSQKLKIRAEKLKANAEEKERKNEELVAQLVTEDESAQTRESVGGVQT